MRGVETRNPFLEAVGIENQMAYVWKYFEVEGVVVKSLIDPKVLAMWVNLILYQTSKKSILIGEKITLQVFETQDFLSNHLLRYHVKYQLA